MATAYAKTTTQKYQPVNIAATGTIKCQNCQMMVAPNQMQIHWKVHANQSYFHNIFEPSLSLQSPKALNLSDLLCIQPNDSESIDQISVKSLLPEQLPNAEQENRPIGFRIQKHEQYKQKQLRVSGFSTEMSDMFNMQRFGQNIQEQQIINRLDEEEIQPSYSPQLEIIQQVPLNPVKMTIQKTTPNLYSNSKRESKPFRDGQRAKKKIHVDEKQNQSPMIEDYDITPLQIDPQRQNIETFEINTQPKLKNHTKSKISTLSTTRGYFSAVKRPQLLINSSALSKFEKTATDDQQNHKYECSECKGFHCQKCGSTIPPIYRPVPNKNGSYLLQPQTNKFYEKYFKGEQNFSQVECSECDYK